MGEEKVLKIVQSGENEQVEFKKSTGQLKEAVISACSFANKSGGTIFFGIKDDGTIIGQTVTDDTLKNVANTIKLNTEPRLFPTVETQLIDSKTCIQVTVEESPLKPHTAYGRPYIRVGASNQQIDQANYQYLIEKRLNGYGFDYQIVPEATIKHIDPDTVQSFMEAANINRALGESIYQPIDQILTKLGLIIEGKLTRAAILLFGNQPGYFFDGHYEVRCGAFADDTSYDEFTSNQQYSGNLFKIFEAAYTFVLDRLQRFYKKANPTAESQWEINPMVIREAIVNMLVHRDYRQGVNSTIEVRPSFIRFYNPAHLFHPIITIENLKKLHPSKPGNKLIAKTFFWAGLMETWGSGTLKITQTMEQAGLLSPSFNFEGDMFELKLFREHS
ncbi:MAG: RNA-binding domain-containing protein [Bacteroidota bacterium]